MNAISKRLLSFAIVLAMVLSMTPVIALPAAAAITAAPTTLADANANKTEVSNWVAQMKTEGKIAADGTFNEADLPNTCPFCGNVTWTAVGENAAGNDNAVATGSHAYFSASFAHTNKTLIQSGTAGPTCVYLNNQNITMKGRILLQGKLNLFGDGSITKNVAYSSYPYLFQMNSKNGDLNIYGGTYETQIAETPTVRLGAAGKFNLYGGKITRTNGNAIQVEAAATVNLWGGTIEGPVNVADSIAPAIKLAGDIQINQPTGSTGLNLNGVQADISELSTDARIHVEGTADTVISAASGNAANVAGCFSVDDLTVAVNDANQLYITTASGEGGGDEPELPVWSDDIETRIDQWIEFYGPTFTAAGKRETVETAICPYCMEENVKWTPKYTGQGGIVAGHFYISEDYTETYSNSRNFANLTADTEPACLYLNGKAVPTVSRLLVNSELTIFGSGSITKVNNTIDGKASYLADPLFYLGNANSKLNIYGGDYKVEQPMATGVDATGMPVIEIDKTGVLNIYDGTFENTGDGTVLQMTAAGTVNMSGGEFKGGSGYIDSENTYGGNIYMTGGKLNLSGDAQIYGGETTGTSGRGGNVYLSGGAELDMSGGSITGGTAYRGGNVYITDGNITMTGGEISGGEATYDGTVTGRYNHNVYLDGSTMYMTGGTVKNSQVATGTQQQRGTAILPNASSTLVLAGTASVVNAETVSDELSFPLYMSKDATNILKVSGDWTGTAHMYYLNEDDTAIAIGGVTTDKGQSGTYANGDFTPGDVDFTGELTAGPNSYRVYSNNDGNLTTATVGIVKAGSQELYDVTWYKNYAAAETAYLTGNVIRLFTDSTIDLTKNVYVDARGKTINVTGSGVLNAIDTGNDDYRGTGSWIVDESVTLVRDVTNPATGYRYINITDTEGVTHSYRLELKLSTVSLRASTTDAQNGVYYKAQISMDNNLAKKVGTYGIALSLANMPGNDFASDKDTSFTAISETLAGEEATVSKTINSGAVVSIMKSTLGTDVNADRGEMDIYANAYLWIDFNGDGEYMIDADTYDTSEFVMANTAEEEIAWSMFDVMDKIDQKWSSFESAQQTVAKFYKHWAQFGMNAWASELPNIKNAADAMA